MKDIKIHYEPHPVSPERKAELRAQGLTIVDIIHAPAGYEAGSELRGDGPTVEQYVQAGYNPRNYPPKGYAPLSSPEEIALAIAKADADKLSQETKGGKQKGTAKADVPAFLAPAGGKSA